MNELFYSEMTKILPRIEEYGFRIFDDLLILFGFLMTFSIVSCLSSQIYIIVSKLIFFRDENSTLLKKAIIHEQHLKILLFLIIVVSFPSGKFFFIPAFIKGIAAMTAGILASSIFSNVPWRTSSR